VVSRPNINVDFGSSAWSEQSLHDQLAKLHTAFNSFMSTRLDEIISPNGASRGPSALVHCPSQASEMSIDVRPSDAPENVDDPEQAAIMALMQVPPGVPYATVEDVYKAMGTHTDTYSLHMRSYHKLLTKAISLGRGSEPIKRLLDETTDAMEASLSPKKPRSDSVSPHDTSITGATLPQPAAAPEASNDFKLDLAHLFDTEESRDAIFKTLGLSRRFTLDLPKKRTPESVVQLVGLVRENCYDVDGFVAHVCWANWVDVLKKIIRSAPAYDATALHLVGIHNSLLAKNWTPPSLADIGTDPQHELTSAEFLQKIPSETGHFVYWFSKQGGELPWKLSVYGRRK